MPFLQLVYASVLFAIVVCNYLNANSPIPIIVTASFLVLWICGCIIQLLKGSSGWKLMLAGSIFNVVAGLYLSGQRILFVVKNHALDHANEDSPGAFILGLSIEVLFVLLPGIIFSIANFENKPSLKNA